MRLPCRWTCCHSALSWLARYYSATWWRKKTIVSPGLHSPNWHKASKRSACLFNHIHSSLPCLPLTVQTYTQTIRLTCFNNPILPTLLHINRDVSVSIDNVQPIRRATQNEYTSRVCNMSLKPIYVCWTSISWRWWQWLCQCNTFFQPWWMNLCLSAPPVAAYIWCVGCTELLAIPFCSEKLGNKVRADYFTSCVLGRRDIKKKGMDTSVSCTILRHSYDFGLNA